MNEVEILQVASVFASPVAILLGVLSSSLLLRRQMRQQYGLSQRNKSLSFSLYNNTHLRDARIEIEDAFGPLFSIREAIPMPDIEYKTKENNHLYASILTVLAHWENMALSIRSDVADEQVCYDMVASTMNQHVRIFRNFIEQRREGNPRIYHNLLWLRREWDDKLNPGGSGDYAPLI